MDLDKIIHIKEIATDGYTNKDSQAANDKVNNYLNNGYKLIGTYTTCYDEELCPQQQTFHYVLGMPNPDDQE